MFEKPSNSNWIRAFYVVKFEKVYIVRAMKLGKKKTLPVMSNLTINHKTMRTKINLKIYGSACGLDF